MTAVPLGHAPIDVEQLTRIERMFEDAERTLNRRLDDILQRGPEWFREEARLRRLLAAAREEMAAIRAALDEPSLARGLGEMYAQGATTQEGVLQQAFNWSQPHLGAVNRIAGDTFDDLLTATKYVEKSAKGIIRQAAKLNTARKLTTGQTAIQAGNALAAQLRASGIGVVTYRNGARHGVGEYSRMVMRTKTAVAYNVGTLNHSVAAGARVFEIFDGSDCGLSYHNDPTLANGMIVDSLTAATYVIAHPQCRRSFGARPDLRKKDAMSFQPSTTAAQRADQQAFEKYLRDQQRGKRVARGPRQPRKPVEPRQPRKPRGESPAPAPAVRPEPVKAPAPKVEPRPGVRGPAPGTTKLGDQFKYLDDRAVQYRALMDEIDKMHGILPLDDKVDEALSVAWGRQTGDTAGYFGGRVPVSGRLKEPRRPTFKGTTAEKLAQRDRYYEDVKAWRAEPRVPRIEIRSKSSRDTFAGKDQFAFAHEVGHRVDYIGATSRNAPRFTTVERAGIANAAEREAVEAFMTAAKESVALQEIRAATVRNFKRYNYVTSAEEVWARAYSQWVATELRTPELLEGLRFFREDVIVGYQWADDEFATLIKPAVEKVLRARGLMT